MLDFTVTIVDTSCLIALEKLQLVGLHCKLYNKVILPEAVINEFGKDLDLNCIEVIKVESSLKNLLREDLNLGSGESEVIAYAHENKVRVIIDDLKARKVAEKLGLRVTGTIGILCKAQKKDLIVLAYDEVLRLKQQGFRVSDEILFKLKERVADDPQR